MADEKTEDDNETNIRGGLDVIQSMIHILADRLEGLRTQCATSAELTQQEIRTLETKLVKMFSELLITKAKLPERLPSGLPANGAELKQWLRVVGLSAESLNIVLQRVNTLENLLEKDDCELRSILNNNTTIRDEEVNRLIRAIVNLKKCCDCLGSGEKEPKDLFWDSWDRNHAHHRTGASPRTNRAIRNQNRLNPGSDQLSSPQSSGGGGGGGGTQIFSPNDSESGMDKVASGIISPEETSTSTITPSPSPPNSPSITSISNRNRSRGGFPTTPPPRRKHQTLITVSNPANPTPQTINNNTDNSSLTKSKSHESQLISNNHNNQPEANLNNQTTNGGYSGNGGGVLGGTTVTTATMTNSLTNNSNHHHANVTTATSTIVAGDDSAQNNGDNVSLSNNLVVPRSPCTPNLSTINMNMNVTHNMAPLVAHRFTKKFKVMSTCDLCNRQIFFALECKNCKYRCHKDCEAGVPLTCPVAHHTTQYVDELQQQQQQQYYQMMNHHSYSPNLTRSGGGGGVGGIGIGGGGGIGGMTIVRPPGCQDSSGSSNNSSTASSPLTVPQNQHSQPIHTSKYTQFNFPEVSTTQSIGGSGGGGGGCISAGSCGGITLETHPIETESSNIPPSPRRPLSIAHQQNKYSSNDSDKTVSNSSASASTDSDRTPGININDEAIERDSVNWPRQNSLSLKEWDIPYDDIILIEKIGKGRFGTVYRALWHGDVAVKVLEENYMTDEGNLEAFKLEVATFKKTRHENVVLFMGACMKPPHLAIVTSLCKGNTLYTHIHSRKDKFPLNKTTLVAQQISQGMGYLHGRGIVHKDLKTKNIFLENGKVIITDFGLFSATKLCYGEFGLGIPQGWLCYLAPELICRLLPTRPTDQDLPFSKASDVYAFGTVWYELLCGEFPFKSQKAEAIIWQVGRGMKQTLANLQASRDVKDILMLCWSFQVDDRPDFGKLLTLLERLPKKRLARSPSHPVQLSRSAESVF